MPNDQSRHLSPASLLIDNDHTYGPKKSNVSLEGVIGNLSSAKHPCPPLWGRVKVAPPNDNTSQKSQKMASNQKTGYLPIGNTTTSLAYTKATHGVFLIEATI
ncbi:unnamed protein product [Prunus brigantina]